jgi:type II secretory pathway pseudopilin PulG
VDRGSTIVESLVSIAVIGIIMAALTTFYVRITSALRHAAGVQTAAEIGADAISVVRSIRGSAIVHGRDKTSSDTMWADLVPGAEAYLTGTQEVWDTTATTGAGSTATVPTGYRTQTIKGVDYRKYWYIGRCWQSTTGGSCDTTPGGAPMYRVVVAVRWPERDCPGGACTYLTSTLVSSETTDPVFLTGS